MWGEHQQSHTGRRVERKDLRSVRRPATFDRFQHAVSVWGHGLVKQKTDLTSTKTQCISHGGLIQQRNMATMGYLYMVLWMPFLKPKYIKRNDNIEEEAIPVITLILPPLVLGGCEEGAVRVPET